MPRGPVASAGQPGVTACAARTDTIFFPSKWACGRSRLRTQEFQVSSGCTEDRCQMTNVRSTLGPSGTGTPAENGTSLSFFVSQVSQELGPVLLVVLAFYCKR